MNDTSQRLFDRLTIALFVVALFLPLAGLFAKWDLKSSGADEKREPAAFPAWSWKADAVTAWPKGVDAWFRDHFGFRRVMIRGHSLVSYFALRTSPTAKVLLGQHGWLYYDGLHARDGNPINEFRGICQQTPFQLERWRWMFQDIQDWLQHRNIRFLLAVIPAKEVIYPEYLPESLPPVGPSANEQVVSYLQEHGCFEMIDVAADLKEARRDRRVFFKTDTHWNRYGAYVGYRAVMGRVAAWYPDVAPWPVDAFNVSVVPYRGCDLARMMDLGPYIEDEAVAMEPLRKRRAAYKRLGEDELEDSVSEVADPALPRAVIFRDSFAEDMIPFLAEHFERAYYVWGRQGVEISAIVNENPDVVVHILSDRILGRIFKYPTAMQGEGNARRFSASTNLLAVIDAAGGYPGIRAVSLCEARSETNGLLVIATNSNARIELPEVRDASRLMPIVRIDLTANGRSDLLLAWNNPRTDAGAAGLRYEVAAGAVRGTNTLYLPLLDPETTGPLTLRFAAKGKYLIHRIEVRGVPRN